MICTLKFFPNSRKSCLRYFLKLSPIEKSLTYFEDAEHEPMPKIFEKILWEQVKKTIAGEVKKAMGSNRL